MEKAALMKNGRQKKKGAVWMAGGALFLAASLALEAYNLWDDRRAKRASEGVCEELSRFMEAEENYGAEEEEIPEYVIDSDREMPVVEIDGNAYTGILEIPALELSLPVMSEWSYEKLKTAPCRYAGSAYAGGFVVAGHNYRAHFTPLKNLEPGTRISFQDVEGNLFFYEVSELETLKPQEVENMKDRGWDLTLFTCTYGGKNRLAVRCRKPS